MNEAIARYVGKECMITIRVGGAGGFAFGKIVSVEGNWLTVRSAGKNGGDEIINIDHITRIRERPKNSSAFKNHLAEFFGET